MEIITILFVTNDINYAKAFTTCVTEENNSIIFSIISSEEFQICENLNEFDLVIIDYMILNNDKKYIEIVDKPEGILETKNEHNIIYRYDTVENISKQLVFIYCKKTGSKYIRPIKKHSKIVLFCSANGGTGKTSIALGLAQELVRFHGKSVLYINFEEFETTDRYFKRDGKKTIANYLYYMETNKELSGIIDNFTITDDYGIRTFSASKGRNQLKLLNIEEIAKFLELVQSIEKFDYILIDGDNSLKEENIWLFSICDKICEIYKWNDDIKQINFNNSLEYFLGKQIFKKIIHVINYVELKEDVIQEDVIQEDKTNKIFIDYDNDSFFTLESEGDEIFTVINIERDFGVGISKLYSKLTLN